MDKKQAASFLKQVMGAYPSFDPTPERLDIWSRNLEQIDYDLAIKRLDKHVATSKFAPTIAEILTPEDTGKRKQQKAEPDTLSPAAIINGGYAPLM